MALLLWALVGSATGLLAAAWLAFTGRRAAACAVLGLGMAVTAAAAALAWALNPEPRTHAAGVATWVSVALLAVVAMAASRLPRWQPLVLAAGAVACGAMTAFGVYLLAGFRIF